MEDNILKFCPIAVAEIQSKLKPLMNNPNFKSGRKTGMNISYSIGYLEFLNEILLYKDLHLTLQVMIIKNFIITSMSIIESIFYYFYKTRLLNAVALNPSVKTKKNDIKFYTALEHIEKNNILSNVDFEGLKELYNKRNKIHIHSEKKQEDLDNHNFRAFYPSLIPKTVQALNSVLVASGFFESNFIKELKFNSKSYCPPKKEDYPF